MKRLAVAAIAALALPFAACGHTKTVTRLRTVLTSQAPIPCPPGKAFAGCATTGAPAPGTVRPAPGALAPASISGPEFPDVSSWQGSLKCSGCHVGWQQVKSWQQQHGWPTGAIFKMGEYHVDPDAVWNAARLKQLGMWSAGYWFERNTGCQHEADQITSTAKQLAITMVWLDAEVPEARGYSSCLLPKVKAAGLNVGVYTGPGTWTGDQVPAGTPLWDAAYNLNGPSTGGLWTSQPSCWQFTDGVFADRTDVPGIGFDDVNLDLQGSSCAKLAAGGTQPATILDTTVRTFNTPGGVVKASEYGTVSTWRVKHCLNPVKRAVCVSSRYHDSLLRDRLYSVVQHYHAGSYNWDHARGRFYELSRVLTQT